MSACGDQGEEPNRFTFRLLLAPRGFPALESRETRDRLLKWSMDGRIAVQAFNFDQNLKGYQQEDFLLAFFNYPDVNSNLKLLSSSGQWTTLGK
uniref:Cilia- and flagella-associated protein 300 n=1 Tax=Salvator merianae TaxID=96440 RepID=A0A8D0C0H7_SALMN